MSSVSLNKDIIDLCIKLRINSPYYMDKIQQEHDVSYERALLDHLVILNAYSARSLCEKDKQNIEKLMTMINRAVDDQDAKRGGVPYSVSNYYLSKDGSTWVNVL